jgi:hypothetical protein
MMRIPRIPVFDRELAMPLPVWGRVRLMDVNMTALTQRDYVGDTVVGIVAVDVME